MRIQPFYDARTFTISSSCSIRDARRGRGRSGARLRSGGLVHVHRVARSALRLRAAGGPQAPLVARDPRPRRPPHRLGDPASPHHETTIAAEKDHNPQLSASPSRDAFIELRTARDRSLASPKLLFPSIQVNVDAGRMPPAKGGRRYLVTPINLFRPADELGER